MGSVHRLTAVLAMTLCEPCAVMEVSTFLKRIVAGSSRCVECLWLHPSVVLVSTPAWDLLCRVCRRGVITKQLVTCYIRDALGKRGLAKWVKSTGLDLVSNPALGKKLYVCR